MKLVISFCHSRTGLFGCLYLEHHWRSLHRKSLLCNFAQSAKTNKKNWPSCEVGSKLYMIYVADLPVMLGNSLASEGHGGCCRNFAWLPSEIYPFFSERVIARNKELWANFTPSVFICDAHSPWITFLKALTTRSLHYANLFAAFGRGGWDGTVTGWISRWPPMMAKARVGQKDDVFSMRDS